MQKRTFMAYQVKLRATVHTILPAVVVPTITKNNYNMKDYTADSNTPATTHTAVAIKVKGC